MSSPGVALVEGAGVVGGAAEGAEAEVVVAAGVAVAAAASGIGPSVGRVVAVCVVADSDDGVRRRVHGADHVPTFCLLFVGVVACVLVVEDGGCA